VFLALKNMIIRKLLFASFIFTLLSCGNDSAVTEKATDLVIGDNGSAQTTSVIYQMPTPNELFVLVENLGAKQTKASLNPTSNVSRYASLKARAVNFGIYSSDLVYASVHDQRVEIARYYLATKKLADGLGISNAFSDMEFVRLERNITKGNADSLEIISTEAYIKAYEKLQAESMGPTLALVVAGGWVESMYLVMENMDPAAPDAKLMKRIAEQKSNLENLIELMGVQSADPEVASLAKSLSGIRDIYDQVNVTRSVHKGESSSGRMVLGDEITLDLTIDKYLELSKAIGELRTELIKPEDQPNI